MIASITNFIANNKKIFYYIGFFFIVFLFSTELSFAAGDFKLSDITNPNGKTAAILSGFTQGFALVLGLLTFLVSLFLDPSWINGSFFNLSDHFREIWILVSNVVYFIFAFLLIWIAFMNIIGKQGDKYQLKQALPKFIVGVLMVPFSWFIVQFILSLSAILTVAALTLPADTFPEFNTALDGIKVPTECTVNWNHGKKKEKTAAEIAAEKKANKGKTAEEIAAEKKAAEEKASKGFFTCDESEDKVPLGEVLKSSDASTSIFGLIYVYTNEVMSLKEVGSLDKNTIFAGVGTLVNLIKKIVFDLLFLIVYAILMITLGLVLLIRGIYLWIYTMMSPVFGLMYFFDKKDGGEGFFEKFNIKEFVALAMVPVYTMLALSFGLLFLFVIGQGLTESVPDSKASNEALGKHGFTIDNSGIALGGSDYKFTLNFAGSVDGSDDTDDISIGSFFKGAKEGALGLVGSLILKIFGIVVLWGAVMAAMRSSSITKAIVEPIHQFGTQVGQLASKSPQYLPVFGGQSMQSMQRVPGLAKSAIDTSVSGKANKLWDKTPFGNDEVTKEYQKITNIKAQLGVDDKRTQAFMDFLKSTKGDVKNIRSKPEAHRALKAMLDGAKIDYKDKDFTKQKDIMASLEALRKGTKPLENDIRFNSAFINDEDFKKILNDFNSGNINTDLNGGSQKEVHATDKTSGDKAYFDINIGGDNLAFVSNGSILERNGVNKDVQVTKLAKELKTRFAKPKDDKEEKKIEDFIEKEFRVTDKGDIKDIMKEVKEEAKEEK